MTEAVNVDSTPDVPSEDNSAPTQEYQQHFDAVQANPVDFTSWVKLLGTCAAQKAFSAVEKAYDGFLAEYPLCYGYWNKYSKEVARFAGQDGVPSSFDVLKRGIKAVPKSLDMWVHYCTAAAERAKADPSNQEHIEEARSIFKQAMQEVGSDPRVNQKDVMLWQAFLTFEQAHGDAASLCSVYVRLLNTPFNRAGNADYHAQWQAWLDTQDEACIAALLKSEGAENIQGLKESVKTSHEEALRLWKERLPYERQLKRYYFHVKPIPERELQGWRHYLSFEEARASNSPSDLARLIGLYERCVVTCAQYPEFWNRYAQTLEDNQKVDEACEVYERAVTLHVKRLPETYLQYAECLQTAQRADRAREVLQKLNTTIPGLAQGVIALANLERRCGRLRAAAAVYEAAITQNPEQRAFIAVRYANFQSRVCRNLGEARHILRSASTAEPDNTDLSLAWIDFELEHGTAGDIGKLFAVACGEGEDQKTPFTGQALNEVWARRLEFLADRGDSVATLRQLRRKHAKYQSDVAAAAARAKRAREATEADAAEAAAAKRKRESEPVAEAPASAATQVATQDATQVATQVAPQVETQVAQPAAAAPAAAAAADAGAYAMAYQQQQQQQWMGAQQQQQQYAQYYWMQQQQQQYGQHYGY